jgi:hypothetical protein
VVYIILAVLLPRFDDSPAPAEPELKADELSARNERIADLERRFKEMEKES